MFSSNLIRSINFISKRYIRKKTYLKSWPNDWVPFHWSRPETIPGYKITGDLEGIKQVTPNELNPNYRNSEKLKQLSQNDPIKKIFTLDHASKKAKNRTFRSDILKEFGLIHEVDFSNSLEAKIIRLTFKLRGLLAEIEHRGAAAPFTGGMRRIANAMKQRRYRYLCELKEINSDRHKNITDKLNIEHHDNLINVKVLEPFRKVQMRKLALEYASSLKEKKVQEFINSLESDKEKFQKKKEETLKWIQYQERLLYEQQSPEEKL